MSKFTNEEIKNIIKEYYNDNGEYPSTPFKSGRYGIPFSYSLIRTRFGGIRNLAEEIGIPTKHNFVGEVSVDCDYCGISFNRLNSELSKNNYCSRECWVESIKGKKDGSSGICPECGKDKTYSADLCRSCYNDKRRLENLSKVSQRPLSDYLILDSASRAKYNSVRTWARKVLQRASDREYECQLCGFDIVVDVCHIKPVSEFSYDDPMGKVNSLDNLIYLCPNHHAMLDKGMITVIVSDL